MRRRDWIQVGVTSLDHQARPFQHPGACSSPKLDGSSVSIEISLSLSLFQTTIAGNETRHQNEPSNKSQSDIPIGEKKKANAIMKKIKINRWTDGETILSINLPLQKK